MSEVKFLYVYDPQLAKYLRFECNIPYITTGYHIKTHDQFWQFWKSDETYYAVQNFKAKRDGVKFLA